VGGFGTPTMHSQEQQLPQLPHTPLPADVDVSVSVSAEWYGQSGRRGFNGDWVLGTLRLDSCSFAPPNQKSHPLPVRKPPHQPLEGLGVAYFLALFDF